MALRGQNEQQKINLQLQEQLGSFELRQQEILKTQAETLKLIREATGADAIMADNVAESYINQADALNDSIKTKGTGPNPGTRDHGWARSQ